MGRTLRNLYFKKTGTGGGGEDTLTSPIVYNLPAGDTLGKLKGSGSAGVIGQTIQSFLREIALGWVKSTITSFVCSSNIVSGTVEIGTAITSPYPLTFTDTGIIGGATANITGRSINVRGAVTANPTSPFTGTGGNFIVVSGTNTIASLTLIETGNTPTNTNVVSTIALTGAYLKWVYKGGLLTSPTTSATIRPLPTQSYSNTINITADITSLEYSIYVQGGLTTGLAMTSATNTSNNSSLGTIPFTLVSITLPDGTIISYKKYTMTLALPYSTADNLRFIFS